MTVPAVSLASPSSPSRCLPTASVALSMSILPSMMFCAAFGAASRSAPPAIRVIVELPLARAPASPDIPTNFLDMLRIVPPAWNIFLNGTMSSRYSAKSALPDTVCHRRFDPVFFGLADSPSIEAR